MRQQSPSLSDRAGICGTDDRADRGQPSLADELLAPLRDELGHLVPDVSAVRENEILHLGPAGIRRLHDAEDAGTAAPACCEERLDRVAPQVRIHGQRVRKRRIAFEERRGVCAGGGTHVAALAVGDDLQAGCARIRAGLLERSDAVRAERLEERDLRLDRHDVWRNRIHETPAEARTRTGRVLASLLSLAAQLDR